MNWNFLDIYFNQSCTQAQFLPPVMLASCVENIWYMINPVSSKQHLAESLWLACGAQGMQVIESKSFFQLMNSSANL